MDSKSESRLLPRRYCINPSHHPCHCRLRDGVPMPEKPADGNKARKTCGAKIIFIGHYRSNEMIWMSENDTDFKPATE